MIEKMTMEGELIPGKLISKKVLKKIEKDREEQECQERIDELKEINKLIDREAMGGNHPETDEVVHAPAVSGSSKGNTDEGNGELVSGAAPTEKVDTSKKNNSTFGNKKGNAEPRGHMKPEKVIGSEGRKNPKVSQEDSAQPNRKLTRSERRSRSKALKKEAKRTEMSKEGKSTSKDVTAFDPKVSKKADKYPEQNPKKGSEKKKTWKKPQESNPRGRDMRNGASTGKSCMIVTGYESGDLGHLGRAVGTMCGRNNNNSNGFRGENQQKKWKAKNNNNSQGNKKEKSAGK